MTQRAIYPWTTWLIWAVAVPLTLIGAGFAAVAATDAKELLFDNAQLWWLGAAGPLAGLCFVYGVARRRRAIERFTSPQLAPLLAERVNPAAQAMRAGVLATAILMIAAGVIGPRWGLYLEKQEIHGVDIVVALDVSRSMLAEDVQPNRLGRAQRELRQQLVERAVFEHANRLALLAFAGSTSLKLPLTTDHLAFQSKLEAVRVGSAPRGGTNIGEAIRRATDLFNSSPKDATKIILLLSDGEDHAGEGLAASKVAHDEADIRVFTVGVGDPTRTVGAQIPIDNGGVRKPLLHDGQIVFTKLDAGDLRDIAAAAGGQYAPIGEFHRLVQAMAGMKQTELSTEERMRHRPRYQWFVAAALILLALETMISDRRASVVSGPQRVWQEGAA